jgi:predicted AAA+ superfamily ATPase
LVTGSARLDHLRKSGDSLLGRYHYYRLHPYSLPELGFGSANLDHLFRFGGFPEPLSEKNDRTLRRWHQARLSRLVNIDLRDLENVKDINKVELLAEELPRRVGSPLSINSLARDLEADPKTVKRWIEILGSLYYSFQIPPYGAPKIRAVRKEQKLYLWDWSQIQDEGVRFENMMASQLLKFCHYHTDVEGHKMELRYIRDTDKREVDFVVIKDHRPLFAVECKLKDDPPSPHLFYFKERTPIPIFYQVSLTGNERHVSANVQLTNFTQFCQQTSMI